MKKSGLILSSCVLALGFSLGSFTNKAVLGEMVWFSDETSNNYAFFDYGNVSYMEQNYGFVTCGTPSERELIGYDKSRDGEAFTVLLQGSGGKVFDAIIVDFPYIPIPNESLYYPY